MRINQRIIYLKPVYDTLKEHVSVGVISEGSSEFPMVFNVKLVHNASL